MKKICVIGGGNIGTSLAGWLAYLKKGNQVYLHSSKPEKFEESGVIVVKDYENDTEYVGAVDCVTSSYEEAVSDADILFITLPHFLTDDLFINIKDYVKPGAYIGMIPGFGGVEFFYKKYFDPSVNPLFGFQRVPFTGRVIEYGKSSCIKSWKSAMQVATIPASRLDEICDEISDVSDFICERCPNYLNVTMTPSNPLLHTARLFDFFEHYDKDHVFEEDHLLYVEWTDHASEYMIGADNELHEMFKYLPEIDFSTVKPLTEHYESVTPRAMTEKLASIVAFKGTHIPLTQVENGYVAKLGARMFIEDFPFGLCIIKGFCEIFNMKTPYIDEQLKWYSNYMGLNWYNGDEFNGDDLDKTGIPQNYGINTKQDIIDFYLK